MPGGDPFLEAFWELSTERQIGYGAGPVPYSAIVGYATWNSLSGADDFACLLQCVREMDAAYLEIVNGPDKGERHVIHDEPLTPAMLKAQLGTG